MNNRIKHRFIPTLILLILFSNAISNGQNNSIKKSISESDSLSLKQIIEQVIASHPTIKIAQEAINNANAKIELAKTGYYPTADVTASYANIGPVTKLSIPNLGSFQLYPENNYDAALNIKQIVYDFGRTQQNVEFENQNKAIGEQTLEQVKQRLSVVTLNNYYTLAYLQAALKIKDEQLAALNEHLEQVQKMLSTGSATEYQVLATKVKISLVESQKLDLAASLTSQQASMNSLLGKDQSYSPVVKSELLVEPSPIPSDSILSFAFRNRDEVLLNEKRTSLAELRYGMVKLQNKPMISFMASGGAKNGYIPDLNKIIPNYVLGLGLSVPIFDGMKNKYNLSLAQSAITSLSFESDVTKRNISNELYEAKSNMEAEGKKVHQFELQLTQALKAYSLAQTSFKSGVITNLDLLDANTAVSESRLMLLKARIDYAASIYKLKVALGERIY
jgi:outer membrane protein